MPQDASFHALNRYSCRRVLEILRRGPQSVSDIHSQMKVGTRANVSQAVALLLKGGLVSMQRQGRNRVYQLRPAEFEELARYCTRLAQEAKRSRNR